MSKKRIKDAPDFWSGARSYLRVELPTIRKTSVKTIEAYRLSLESYILFLEVREDIKRSQVGFEHFERRYIKEFVKWMNEVKQYAPKTVGLRLTAVRSFLGYAAQEDMTLVSLARSAKTVKGPKAPKKPIEYLAHETTVSLLAAPTSATTKERRDRVLLIVLYDTGARVSEICGIKVSDLHLGTPAFVSLLGKGNKPRNVPLMDKTVEHLKAYLAEFHPGVLPRESSEPLFYSNRDGAHKALSTDTIATILDKYAARARKDCEDMPKHLTCHTIRKTRAMDLYQEGVPLPIIMRLLGHENTNTTSTFYAFATMKMVTDAIESTDTLNDLEPKKWESDLPPDVDYIL
jgi:site-specific recombinase XerD